jgi:hypothetical protein
MRECDSIDSFPVSQSRIRWFEALQVGGAEGIPLSDQDQCMGARRACVCVVGILPRQDP